jgi:hypothetical protein
MGVGICELARLFASPWWETKRAGRLRPAETNKFAIAALLRPLDARSVEARCPETRCAAYPDAKRSAVNCRYTYSEIQQHQQPADSNSNKHPDQHLDVSAYCVCLVCHGFALPWSGISRTNMLFTLSAEIVVDVSQ